jgi:hypothetical protein
MLDGRSLRLGTLAASSLVIGAIVAFVLRIGLRAIGLIMGFGAGVLISAVAFDLVEEAVDKSSGHGCRPLAIVLGTVLDGIPESMVIGLTIFRGRSGGGRLLGPGLHLQPARIDLLDLRPCHQRLAAVAHPLDVGRDRADLGTRLARRLPLFQDSSPDTAPSFLPSRPARSSRCSRTR